MTGPRQGRFFRGDAFTFVLTNVSANVCTFVEFCEFVNRNSHHSARQSWKGDVWP